MSTTDVLAWTGNILNLLYNIPQVILVLKHRSARNISKWFLVLRIFSSMTWVAYAWLENDKFITASYLVTLLSSCIMLIVKINEACKENNIEAGSS